MNSSLMIKISSCFTTLHTTGRPGTKGKLAKELYETRAAQPHWKTCMLRQLSLAWNNVKNNRTTMYLLSLDNWRGVKLGRTKTNFPDWLRSKMWRITYTTYVPTFVFTSVEKIRILGIHFSKNSSRNIRPHQESVSDPSLFVSTPAPVIIYDHSLTWLR